MFIDRSPASLRRCRAGLVAAALIALAPATASAEPEYIHCDCVPPDNGDCSCEETFNIRPLANHTYRGHCTFFDTLVAVTDADGHIHSWEDTGDGNEYTQSMDILEKRHSTACGENAYDREFRIQRCVNISMMSEDTVTNRVVCTKRARQAE